MMIGAQRVLALYYFFAERHHSIIVTGGPTAGADMYCVSKAAHGGVAHAREHAHHSNGSAHHVYDLDAKNAAECGRNDGGVECTARAATGIVIDARPTRGHGICETALIRIAHRFLLTRFENPDIVQAFFGCLDTVSFHLVCESPRHIY